MTWRWDPLEQPGKHKGPAGGPQSSISPGSYGQKYRMGNFKKQQRGGICKVFFVLHHCWWISPFIPSVHIWCNPLPLYLGDGVSMTLVCVFVHYIYRYIHITLCIYKHDRYIYTRTFNIHYIIYIILYIYVSKHIIWHTITYNIVWFDIIYNI